MYLLLRGITEKKHDIARITLEYLYVAKYVQEILSFFFNISEAQVHEIL